MTWTTRHAVLRTLRDVDLDLWVRCVAELGPDEVLLSYCAVAHVEDLSSAGAIPLPNRTSEQHHPEDPRHRLRERDEGPRRRLRRKTRMA